MPSTIQQMDKQYLLTAFATKAEKGNGIRLSEIYQLLIELRRQTRASAACPAEWILWKYPLHLGDNFSIMANDHH